MTPAAIVEAVFPAAECDTEPSWYTCTRTPEYTTYLPGMAVRCFHRRPGGLSAGGEVA